MSKKPKIWYDSILYGNLPRGHLTAGLFRYPVLLAMKNFSRNTLQEITESMKMTAGSPVYPARDLLAYGKDVEDMSDDPQDNEQETERGQDAYDIDRCSIYPKENVHEEHADNDRTDTHHCGIRQPLNDTNV
jgi:hypothetical protein